MPVADSILWSPAINGPQRSTPLIFIAQYALRRIHERLATIPNGLGLGLLAGRRQTCARTGAAFVVIDGVLPLPALADEDEARAALAEGLRTAATGIEMFGWYRGHSFADAALTPADVEVHTELFGDASYVIVVAGGGETGGVFLQSSSPAWPIEARPFYELLADPAVRADGRKPTTLSWRNYRTAEPVARLQTAPPTPGPTAVAPPSRANYPVLFPEDSDADDEAPKPTPPARWRQRVRQPATYVAAAIGGAVGVALLSGLLGLRASGGPSGGAGSGPGAVAGRAVAPDVLDRQADTLALAIAAFDARSRMLEARQMTCAGLARGLEQVEDQWLAYNVARKGVLAPFDSAREARDRGLYADVRAVERRFERSACERP